MPDNNQNSINLPEGILIKTPNGMKKVQSGKITDIETARKEKKEVSFKSPDFYYHPDDEEEIKLQQDKLKIIEERPTVATPEAIIEKIIQKNNLNFPDDIIRRRFFNIIQSRLIEVRDSIETEEILMRSTKIGGMGFDQNFVYKIMQDVENDAVKIHEFKQIATEPTEPQRPQKTTETTEVVEPTEITKGAEKKEEIFIPKIPKVEEKEEVAPISPAPPPIAFMPVTTEVTEMQEVTEMKPLTTESTEKPEPIEPQRPQKTTETTEVAEKEIKPTEEIPYIKVRDLTTEVKPEPKKVEVEEKIKEIEKFEKKIPKREFPQEVRKEQIPAREPLMPLVTRQKIISEEPKVTDIKIPKKIIGPVEELQDLSLTDFRRLGRDLNEIINKIRDKVELLEEESFSLMTQGIEAWRNSEVNKLYLEIGNESINKNQPINVIIDGRKRNNLPYLAKEEFLAIADLNKHLNY